MREIVARQDVHIVLMDVVLPGGETGLELAEELIASGLAVILMTGSHEHFERVEQSGIRYLHKPFRIPMLMESIAAALRAAHADCDQASRGDGASPPLGGRALARSAPSGDETRLGPSGLAVLNYWITTSTTPPRSALYMFGISNAHRIPIAAPFVRGNNPIAASSAAALVTYSAQSPSASSSDNTKVRGVNTSPTKKVTR